jgi:TolB-like protein
MESRKSFARARWFSALLFTFIALHGPLLAQVKQAQSTKKLNIAVLDFDARGGLTKEEAASLSDIFQSRLVSTNEFTVVDRNRIKAILSEQGFQQSEACSQVECIADVGRILKVDRMFAGTIGKIGSLFNINIQVIDVTTAAVTTGASRQYSGAIEDLASEIIPEMAAEIANGLTGKDVKVVSTTSGGGTSWLWYLGGAAVIGGVAYAVLGGKSAGETQQGNTLKPLTEPPAFP